MNKHTPLSCGCYIRQHPEFEDMIFMCPTHAAAPEMLDLIKRMNYAFYVDGTAKALRPIMAETKALIAKATGGK